MLLVGHRLAQGGDLLDRTLRGRPERLRRQLLPGPAKRLRLAEAGHLEEGLVDFGEAVVLAPVDDADRPDREGCLDPVRDCPSLAFGHNLRGGFPTGAEEAGDSSILASDRRVGEGEMRLLWLAAAMHQERDVVHLHGLTGISLVDERRKVVLDLGPDIEKGSAKGPGALLGQNRCVGLIVDEDAFRSPDDEHRLS